MQVLVKYLIARFLERIQREQMVIGASQMRRNHQSQAAHLALNRQLTIFVIANRTEIAAGREPTLGRFQMTLRKQKA